MKSNSDDCSPENDEMKNEEKKEERMKIKEKKKEETQPRASHCVSLDHSQCLSHSTENEVWDRGVHSRLFSLHLP